MKLKYFLVLLLALFIEHLTFNITYATVRYVSKTGSSTPPYTSWETASDSIQKCINLCVDGDTIYVANGVYKENLVINTAISLIGSSMDSTVIDGRGMGQFTIWLNEAATIENFNIYGKGLNTIQTAAVTALKYFEIKYCRISEASDGVALINSANVVNLIVTNCLAGLGLAPISDTCKVFIDNNLFLLNNESAKGIATGVFGIYYIRDNIILFTGINNPGKGISIGAPRKVYIENNLISGFGSNIYIDVIIDTAFIKNNILSYNKIGWPLGSIQSDGNYVIVNNVILPNNKVGVDGDSRLKSDYNIFWENNLNLVGITYGNSDIVADPMFVKDTIPTANGNYDFHLQKYSPAIDKGDPNILDLDGTRSDIGMYGGPFGETYTYQDLAPLAPRNLSAVVDLNAILVKWNKNTEADTAYYKVYRDTVSGFAIDSTKLVSSSKDTFFVQPIPHNIKRYVYKVTCVDKQGNESKPSEELIVNITSVFTNDYPMTISDYILYQNYPNPFNPSTKIGYQLKSGGYVKLMVYDIKGELVSVLVNKEQNAGYYEVEFNVGNGLLSVPDIPGLASGIYLYRIEVIGAGRIPVYTEMKKMLLIK
ncbi:MAG: hypothetical protein F9K42_00730 [Ignavibacterium sp.]|nr:MAG: hypothetical protein F9K42_00730 [Ignavibacterium sp.]GIK22682.1 MAG: hypothetical protein BroJett005_20960 [Ignavibacteriota bacterium]